MNSVLKWIAILVVVKIAFFAIRLTLGIAQIHFFGGGGGEDNAAAAEPYRAVGEQFGLAVIEERWPDAYGLMTSDFRSRRSLEQFVGIMRSAEAEYVAEGRALNAEGYVNAFGEEIADADFAHDYEIPAGVPTTPPWKAFVCNQMALELDDEGDVYRCYPQGLLMVEEPEGARVAFVDYWWCD